MRRIGPLVVGVALAGLVACNGGSSPEVGGASDLPAGCEGNTAVIEVAGRGTIRAELLADKAPGTVENFKKLACQGFYDGTTFHRVIPGFMIQGGDPNSKDADPMNDGTGGPGYQIKAEFNDTRHERGILSMARSAHPDSAGSQFFITVAPAPHLDNQYTAFGRVTSGMEVVDEIVGVKRGRGDRPVANVVMESVRIE